MRLGAELGIPLLTACGTILAAGMAQPRGLDAIAVRLHAAADVMLEEIGFEYGEHDDDDAPSLVGEQQPGCIGSSDDR